MARSQCARGILSLGTPGRRASTSLLALLPLLVSQRALLAQTSLTGSSMALKSLGSATISSPGYLGAYLTIPSGGATINFTANATEGVSGVGALLGVSANFASTTQTIT